MWTVLGDVAPMRRGWTSAQVQSIALLPSWIEGPDLHMDFRPDPAYLLEVAATGVVPGFDSFSKRTYLPDEAPGRAHLARGVVPLPRAEGFGDGRLCTLLRGHPRRWLSFVPPDDGDDADGGRG